MARGLIAVTSDTRLAAAAISALRLLVERPQQRPLGDVDQVAPVDDRARRVLDLGARARGLRPVAVERDEPADELSRRVAVVGGARRGEGDMHLGDPRLARDRDDLARDQADEPDEEQHAEGEADQPERLGLGEQALDQARRPEAEGERDEAAEARPEQARRG